MLHRFEQDIDNITPPKQFTWPFHYVPHTLSRIASEEVERYLRSRSEWSDEIAQGKMFGVMVVRDSEGLGFLAAYSGNLAGRNDHDYFVPPIYDMLRPEDFFRRGEAEVSAINARVEELQQSAEYLNRKQELDKVIQQGKEQLEQLKSRLAQRKEERDRRRAEGEDVASLILESQRDNADMQRLKRKYREAVTECEARLAEYSSEIAQLKTLRQQRSADLQMQLFKQFRVVNGRGQTKDLCELFATTPQGIPPAGAGECAGPKLLQYALMQDYEPIAMAEFWQGASPRGEVRHHGSFYPACNGKCKPILSFMLEGLNVEPNPLTAIEPDEPKILWEDEWIVAIDKPCGMLSVEGKSGVRSAEAWAKEHYPEAEGPMIVHRLDQSTSGILLLAKDKETHKALQEQFIKRTIEKRYTAVIEGIIESDKGVINLPMRLDYDNRPRQMVASDGKPAVTEYKVLAREGQRSRIEFRPITGRTHQLRLHSAHKEGLNAPIVGDNIYGTEITVDLRDGSRLHLHASKVEFSHPQTGKRITIESPAEF